MTMNIQNETAAERFRREQWEEAERPSKPRPPLRTIPAQHAPEPVEPEPDTADEADAGPEPSTGRTGDELDYETWARYRRIHLNKTNPRDEPVTESDQILADIYGRWPSPSRPKTSEQGARPRPIKTLFDLPYGDPEPQLVAPFLSPNGVTVIYGPGGVGKGMFSVWIAQQLVQSGHKPMIIDFESHDDEWPNRARSLGFTEDELRAIKHHNPWSDDWNGPRGSLKDIATFIREDCDDYELDYLIIDSYSAATSTGDSMGGKDAAQEFFDALRLIARPALVIAHVAGNSNRFPDKPFGSVFVHNFARETWAVESSTTDAYEPAWDRDASKYQPETLKLELRNKKMNVGRKPHPQFITFSFYADGHTEVVTETPKPPKAGDIAYAILSRAKKGLNASEIAKFHFEKTGEEVLSATIAKACRRHADITLNEQTSKWQIRSSNGTDE